MTHQAPMVELKQVCKHFGKVKAVHKASFAIPKGSVLTILGPSGCGKTTLLRMIAGFDTPTAGEIYINGEPVSAVPPHRRSIGMVFQKLALFPHMTAAANIAYPLKMRRFDPQKIPALVERYLKIVQLEEMGHRRIHELSGGQQQRVAIARALSFGPDLLLLDEPLSALDRKLREEMQLEFRRIQQELGVTTINVTHDQREALVMSDKIIVMADGIIQQNDDPVSLYRAPSTRFVAHFIGLTASMTGRIVEAQGGEARVAIGELILGGRTADTGLTKDAPVDCAIRAEQVRILKLDKEPQGLDNAVEAVVEQRIFEGDRMVYQVRCGAMADNLLFAYDHDPAHHNLHQEGERVRVCWNRSDLFVYASP